MAMADADGSSLYQSIHTQLAWSKSWWPGSKVKKTKK